MKVILKAFGIFEQEYDTSVKEGQPLYFIHKDFRQFMSMKAMINLDKVPDRVFRKAVFEWNGKWEDDMPIYEFVCLE